MDRKSILEDANKAGHPPKQTAVRLMLLSPTSAFEGEESIGWQITEDVAGFFGVSVRSVHACGSAKLGFSPVKGTAFVPRESDLDLSVIDSNCFLEYVGKVIKVTDQYRDRTGFTRGENGESTYRSFVDYLAKGIFRPDFMPLCPARSEWFGFFRKLSAIHSQKFGKISAAIYLSDEAFALKQSSVISSFGVENSL